MTRTKTTEFQAVIETLERMRSSYYGNPRFRVTFRGGRSAATAPDAACAYGIENRENRAPNMVRVTLDGRGNIAYVTPTDKAGLGVGHQWQNTHCLAYRTLDSRDCVCSEGTFGAI